MKLTNVVAALAIGLAIAPSAALAQKVIKYAHFQPAQEDQPKHKAALAFKEYVESKSKGQLKVQIYPGRPVRQGRRDHGGAQARHAGDGRGARRRHRRHLQADHAAGHPLPVRRRTSTPGACTTASSARTWPRTCARRPASA